MNNCWRWMPKSRPSFTRILSLLQDIEEQNKLAQKKEPEIKEEPPKESILDQSASSPQRESQNATSNASGKVQLYKKFSGAYVDLSTDTMSNQVHNDGT